MPKSNRQYWASKIARNRERDAQADILLEEAGWMVLRFWEHEPVDVAAEAIASIVAPAPGSA